MNRLFVWCLCCSLIFTQGCLSSQGMIPALPLAQDKVMLIKKVKKLNWHNVLALSSFEYPWRTEQPSLTTLQVVHDDENIYFKFIVEDTNVYTYVKNNDKMEAVYGDRVELFFKSDDVMKPYYCLEMDALGRVLDYRAEYYRQMEYDWSWEQGLDVFATQTAIGYEVSGKISKKSLIDYDLLKNKELQVGVFRAECVNLIGKKGEMKWISWINPQTPQPDFHVASAFGKWILLD